MEEPTVCINCGDLFELSEGHWSDKWHPDISICKKCSAEEQKENQKDEEIEDLKANLSDAESTIERYRIRLQELGVDLPETKAEKWDKLDNKISEYYKKEYDEAEDEEYGDGLIGIGEAAARAFGYL